VDRYWFFTWRTYGTWLPGDEGFVGFYRTASGEQRTDNRRGEPATEAMPPLAEYAGRLLAHEPVLLTPEAAGVVLIELLRTCRHRGWQLDAVAVLADHVHFVFGVPGDPAAEDLLREIKSYTSRALNRAFGCRHWWVVGGSTRPVKGEGSRQAVIRYTNSQTEPLVVWLGSDARKLIE
jgi:REP element-mobilizing transposase RayT